MLVYCIRHRVPTGHLIYAAGNEPRASHAIEEAGVTILCHALDLDAPGPVISAQVDAVVAQALARS
jgi:5-methylcytosine-specific restriction enzyme subunit McrC